MTKRRIKKNNGTLKQTSIIIIISVLVLSLGVFLATRSVKAQIIKYNTTSMEELTLHDENSVRNSINIRWKELENASAVFDKRIADIENEQQLCAELKSMSGMITSSDYILLLSDEGVEYRSTGLVAANEQLAMAIEGHNARFVDRYNDNADKWIETRKEMLIMAVPVDYKLDDVHFSWLVCRFAISTLEEELKIDSYEGEGFSSVIDTDGNYIINISRTHSVGVFDNFFNDLKDAAFEDAFSIEDIRTTTTTTTGPRVLRYTLDGREYIMVISAVDYADWYFISTVPVSVFNEQARSIMITFSALLVGIAAAAVLALFLILRQRIQDENLRIANAENQTKTTFLFNMSHDIRTPMNAILGFTRIAKKHVTETERVKDSLDKIEVSGSMLLNLINDILEMSRIEAGKLDIIEEPSTVTFCAEEINPMIESLAIEKSLSYEYIAADIEDKYVYLDIQHMERALVNLLTNAVKYTNKGGKVSFKIEQAGKAENGYASYRFIIKDTGVGMSKEFVDDHLFEQFSREKTSTITKQQGTGLGLAIAKRIVDACGGTIDVESEQDKGTTFTINMKLRLQSDEEIESKYIKGSGPAGYDSVEGLEGKMALLVEDNKLNLEIGKEILEEAGIVVDTAEDGLLAVEAVKEKGPDYYDFILMDIQMPVMNGYEATEEIRRLPGGDKICIIAVSANAFAEDKQKSLSIGMNDHIAKPININDLISIMRNYV